MAHLKKLSDVKVGTIVKLGGTNYHVMKNLINDLVVSRAGHLKRASELTYGLKHDSLITIIAEPEASQAPKASLADQFKSQLAASAASGTFIEHAKAVDEQARFAAEVAKMVAKKAESLAQGTAKRVEEVEDEISDIHDKLDDFSDETSENQAILARRLGKLEAKELARNTESQLQATLNAKLAEQKTQPKLGGNKMSKLTQSFKGLFGKVEGQFAFAATGQIAMRNGLSENFITYNAETGIITDVQGLVLDFKVPAFRLPVEAKDVKVGSIIANNGAYGYVKQTADGFVRAVFPTKNTEEVVVPTANLFLQKPFYTVIQTLDVAGQNGFNPALLLAMGDGKKDDILPFLLMSGGLGGQASSGAIDPTMLMLLGDNMDDLLPFLLFQQGGLTQNGFNPLMLLAMGDKGGKGSKDSLLPLLLMSGGLGGAQGGAQGGFNPLMLLAMGDGDIDPMTLMLMSGGFGGQNPFAPANVQVPVSNEETAGE